MLFGRMAFVFEVMVYLGLGLPLVNLLLGLISGLAGGASGADAGGELATEADLDVDFDVDVDFDIDADFDLDADFDIDADLDIDTPEIDGGAAGASGRGFPVRFNMYCLCLAMVVMGAIGVFALETQTGLTRHLVLGGGLVLAVAAYVVLYRFVVLPLKKNKAEALNINSLRFRHAKVTFRILQDSPGKILTKDAVGALITYPAQMDEDLCKLERIDEGQEVVITDLDPEQNICYVTLAQRKILN